jgi:polyphenol oxidase
VNSSFPASETRVHWRETTAGQMLEFSVLSGLAEHGVTSRQLRFREPTVEDDYRVLALRFGVQPDQIARVRQVHGKAVLTLESRPLPATADADAIVSTVPGLVVSVRIADCVPVLIADTRGQMVAAVHAGWRGTAAGVSAETIRVIRRLGIDPSTVVAAIGPSIGPCCYQVASNVRDEMRRAWPTADAWFTEDGNGRWKLDLWRANREQLEAEGVRSGAISVARLCTAHNLDRLFSHRREGAETGRMVAAIQRTR